MNFFGKSLVKNLEFCFLKFILQNYNMRPGNYGNSRQAEEIKLKVPHEIYIVILGEYLKITD